jgi:F-type H+-transporting ATPase subunit b
MLGVLAKLAADVASEEAAAEGLFASLGIDWKILLLQAVAFLLLVVILAKFIYPQINAMLDRRDKQINDAIEAAKLSESNAAKSEKETLAALGRAREEAESIVEAAKKESADIVATTEFDAKKKADEIVRSAQVTIEKDVNSARKMLRGEVLDLVANATEKVASIQLGSDDEKLVSQLLKGKANGNKS